MVDTVQTIAYLTGTEAPDSTAVGGYSLQYLRDFMVSAAAWGGIGNSAATASAAGTNQGTATALTAYNTIVTTVASGTGVLLLATTLVFQRVWNRGANPLLVYPSSGVNIESLAANAAITVPVGGDVQVVVTSATQAYLVGAAGWYAPNMPTSPTGLVTGNLWRNGNLVTIV